MDGWLIVIWCKFTDNSMAEKACMQYETEGFLSIGMEWDSSVIQLFSYDYLNGSKDITFRRLRESISPVDVL